MKKLFAILILSISACSQQISSDSLCTTKFTVYLKDKLGNVTDGLSGDTLKWVNEKTAKKYPDICYVAATDPHQVVFYISISTGVYQGSRRETSTTTNPVDGTITDQTV